METVDFMGEGKEDSVEANMDSHPTARLAVTPARSVALTMEEQQGVSRPADSRALAGALMEAAAFTEEAAVTGKSVER